MATQAGSLNYKFSVDISEMKKQLDEMRAAMKKSADDAASAAQQMQAGLEGVSAKTKTLASIWTGFRQGLGQGFAQSAFRELSKAASDYIAQLRQMQEVSQRTFKDVSQLSGLMTAGRAKGVGSSAILSGVDALGEKANKEFREGEGELTKLLEDNNKKLTDRQGRLKSVNDLLLDAADLVRRASNEYDAMDIARVFGLSKEWVKVLEQGGNELKRAQTEAANLGGTVDKELAQKAREFDVAWSAAWSNFRDQAKRGILDVSKALAELAQRAASLGFGRGGLPTEGTPQPNAQQIAGGYVGEIIGKMGKQQAGGIDEGQRGRAFANLEPITKLPPPDKGGGGASRATVERMDGVERYLSQMQRSVELAKAEFEAFGKGTAERLKAVNLVRGEEVARRENRNLTEEERTKIAGMSEDQARFNDQLERARDIQQGLKDLASTFSSAIEDWIARGAKFKDVLANLAQSLASMAIRGTLTGDGPFGKLLGLGGKDGATGGLFGAIFSAFGGGKASGGPVSPSKGYVVGENGPEWFQPNSAGTILPNGTQSTAATGPKVTIHQTFTADANPRELAQMAGKIKAETMAGVKMAIARGSL